MDTIVKSARRMYPFLCLFLSVEIPGLKFVAPVLLFQDVHWKVQDGGRNAVKGVGERIYSSTRVIQIYHHKSGRGEELVIKHRPERKELLIEGFTVQPEWSIVGRGQVQKTRCTVLCSLCCF